MTKLAVEFTAADLSGWSNRVAAWGAEQVTPPTANTAKLRISIPVLQQTDICATQMQELCDTIQALLSHMCEARKILSHFNFNIFYYIYCSLVIFFWIIFSKAKMLPPPPCLVFLECLQIYSKQENSAWRKTFQTGNHAVTMTLKILAGNPLVKMIVLYTSYTYPATHSTYCFDLNHRQIHLRIHRQTEHKNQFTISVWQTGKNRHTDNL